MLIITWVGIGVAVGLVATTVSVGLGRMEDTIVAVVGSVAGGWLFVSLSGMGVLDMSLAAAAAGLAGTALLLTLSRLLARRQETT